MAAVADSPRRFIRVKRKASEAQDNIDSKKFKFLGSSKKGDDQTVKELIVTKTPSLAVFDEDLMIMDFEDFIAEGKEQQFPKKKEVITCNGVPLIAAPSNIGLDGPDEDVNEKYVYDVYLYEEAEEKEQEEVFVGEAFQEVRDDDYSSNDEDNPNNDYPDDDEYDFNEYDYYRDYEDDETKQMMKEFEKNCLDPERLAGDSDDEYGQSQSDESWARDEV